MGCIQKKKRRSLNIYELADKKAEQILQITKVEKATQIKILEGSYLKIEQAQKYRNNLNANKNIFEIILIAESNTNYEEDKNQCSLFTLIADIDNLQKLKLETQTNNKLGLEGSKNLGHSIMQFSNLKHLIIKIMDINLLGSQGGNYIGESFQNCKHLEELEYTINQYLFFKFIFLQVIFIFSGNKIAVQGGQALSKSMLKCKQLTKVKLVIESDNELESEGAIAIGQGLKNCSNLIDLNLEIGKNDIGPEGISQIGISLQSMKNLLSLDINIQNNKMQETGAIKLSEGIKTLNNLLSLKLCIGQLGQLNYVKQESLAFLGISLNQLKNLQYCLVSLINHENNLFNDQSKLQNQIKHSPKLTQFYMYLS
ncbi:hypothetical protein ABPG74_000799 [Tetrahymena malaccensis]